MNTVRPRLTRRALVGAVPGLAAWPALASSAPPALAAYERETGGRVGVFARNLATGATLAWRADERFVMCSSFKASLAALVLRRVDRGQERLDAPVRFAPPTSSTTGGRRSPRQISPGASLPSRRCARPRWS